MKIKFTFSGLGSNSNDCVRKLGQSRETVKGNTKQIYLDIHEDWNYYTEEMSKEWEMYTLDTKNIIIPYFLVTKN